MDNRLIEDVPQELATKHYVENLSNQDLGRAMQVSKYCYGIFNSPQAWETRILSQFHVDPDDLAEVVRAYKRHANTDIFDYKFLFKQRLHLSKIEHKLPKPLRFYYADSEYAVQVLTCCMNDQGFAEKVIPAIELFGWLELAIYAGFNDVAKLLEHISQDIDNQAEILIRIIRSGNLELAQWHYDYLEELIYNNLAANNYLQLNYSDEMVKAAILSFSFEMVEWVIDVAYKEQEYYFLPSKIGSENLALAYQSGKFEFVKALEEKLNCKIEVRFSHVIASGNLPFIEEVLKANNRGFERSMLEDAALHGHMEVVLFGIKKVERFDDFILLSYAAKSNNLELFKYLLVRYNTLKFNEATWRRFLESAALSGNSKLFNYCQQVLRLKVDFDMFQNIALSNNLFFTEQIRQQYRFNLNESVELYGADGITHVLVISLLCGRTRNPDMLLWKEKFKFFTCHLPNYFEGKIDTLIDPFYICLLAEALQYPAEYAVKEDDLPKLVALLERVMPHITRAIDLGEYLVDKKYIDRALKAASAALLLTQPNLASILDDLRESLHNREFKNKEHRPIPTTVTVNFRGKKE